MVRQAHHPGEGPVGAEEQGSSYAHFAIEERAGMKKSRDSWG